MKEGGGGMEGIYESLAYNVYIRFLDGLASPGGLLHDLCP